jgi:hypothetical protein
MKIAKREVMEKIASKARETMARKQSIKDGTSSAGRQSVMSRRSRAQAISESQMQDDFSQNDFSEDNFSEYKEEV